MVSKVGVKAIAVIHCGIRLAVEYLQFKYQSYGVRKWCQTMNFPSYLLITDRFNKLIIKIL